MKTRQQAITYGLTFPHTYVESPFKDPNWELVRVKGSKKAFLWVYEKDGYINLNIKVDPEWREFWREAYDAVIPGYHQNKKYWNTIILDGTNPEKDIKKITALCDEVEDLLKKHEDHTQKDIDFHAAIALSSKNVVVPRLVPVINSSIPLFVETTRGTLLEETIETHREIADAIAAHDPLRAQDAMYLHLVYNRKRIQMIEK